MMLNTTSANDERMQRLTNERTYAYTNGCTYGRTYAHMHWCTHTCVI